MMMTNLHLMFPVFQSSAHKLGSRA